MKSIYKFSSVKKHTLQHLMNVLESFFSSDIFQINSHVPMIYMNHTI
jgi:hypothetical protein